MMFKSKTVTATRSTITTKWECVMKTLYSYLIWNLCSDCWHKIFTLILQSINFDIWIMNTLIHCKYLMIIHFKQLYVRCIIWDDLDFAFFLYVVTKLERLTWFCQLKDNFAMIAKCIHWLILCDSINFSWNLLKCVNYELKQHIACQSSSSFHF